MSSAAFHLSLCLIRTLAPLVRAHAGSRARAPTFMHAGSRTRERTSAFDPDATPCQAAAVSHPAPTRASHACTARSTFHPTAARQSGTH
jgi:hypothetical protein